MDDVFVSTPSDPNPAPHVRSDPYSTMYVSEKDAESIAREETLREKKREGKAHYVNRDVPNQGNTVYVKGAGVSEEALRSEFSLHGSILQISLEPEKSCAFVTFEAIEEANRAIEAVNGLYLDGVQVSVSLARKQMKINRNSSSKSSGSSSSHSTPSLSDSTGSNSWAALAANYYKEDKEIQMKSNSKAKRQMVAYDEVPDL
jgi:RNA recognition motif-containing protein